MSIKKKPLVIGTTLALTFWATLITMFMPIFEGETAFEASDKLFNTISKGSTHYIPKLINDGKQYDGQNVDMELSLESEALAREAEMILSKAGVDASHNGVKITIKGDLGKVYSAVLQDSDDMFYNKGKQVSGRYGIDEKRTLFVWWHVLREVAKSFNKIGNKENFVTAKYTNEVTARGVEVAYNFYGIQPESVSSKAFILTGVLLFYVIYTLWWGFAIFYLAEGAGLKLEGGHKEET